MRLVIDLQACQSEVSAGRGVGRYAESLAMHIADRIGDDDLRLCFNKAGDDSLERAIARFERRPRRQQLSAYRYAELAPSGAPSRGIDVAMAEVLVRRHWMSLQPDVLHVSHVFEGFHGQAVVPGALPAVSGLVRTATLYDLIPLRFPEHYLADPAYKAWYFQKIATLRDCEHILAISESTKRDAIELAGIAGDRITTIDAGVDPCFRQRPMTVQDASAFRARYGLRRRMVLYTGGDDHRKNLLGAVAGFAALPAPLRHDAQLVIACALSAPTRQTLLGSARSLGLGADAVVLTGYVPEDDLVSLYNLCDAFIFPSLYEGFGLPVLEAMRCGAPVVGADTSSIAQLIGRSDALFDAHKPAALAERLAAVLEHEGLRDELRAYGLRRSETFSWERSAGIAVQALREAHARARRGMAAGKAAASPKKRLALFTPLPPCHSGIADYNAAFLPYLARHFDIDLFIDRYEVSDGNLRARFAIRSHQEFETRRRDYAVIVYEMGNSEFHAYMLDYMARFPGVVVLHDAFLSGLFGYVDFHLGQTGTYVRQMLSSHGPRARRYLAPAQQNPDPIGASMINLPASKSVIASAIGVISHTPFNTAVARDNYPEGFATPYRTIKQVAIVPEPLAPQRRRDLRTALGFAQGDFVVCTYGHITWTKCGDILLDAFGRSALARDPGAKLVYVGEMARDAFGHQLQGAIGRSALKQRIQVTGYVDDRAFTHYLAVADLAVQLRTQTRGGTSKAILDCLAHGVPVVANDAGSFGDYADDILYKVPAVPETTALAHALDTLYARRAELPALGAAGRDQVIAEHDPGRVADQFALAIDEFLQRSSAVSLPATMQEIAGIVTNGNAVETSVARTAAAFHENLLQPLFSRQRILVDVTHITDGDQQTGIQRVVRNTVRGLYCSARTGFDVVAVRLDAGTLVEASAWLRAQGLLPGDDATPGEPGSTIVPRWGDILLMLDSSWAKIDAYLPLFEDVRREHGKVYAVIYDLLPIKFPHMFVDGGAAWFAGWLEKALRNSDGYVCISRAIADELEALIKAQGQDASRQLGYWHLGCDFRAAADSAPTERARRATLGRTLIMVGTIEPRKNHALALDAMELLWARGVDANLCIAGKRGWMVDQFMARMSTHVESGRRLRFIDGPDDEELLYCYAHSAALLLPSAGEGFGLPLIEAAQCGTPILASDIPVFREIAGDHATYFPIGNAEQLATTLESWLAAYDRGTMRRSGAMPRLTWEQSADALLDVLLDNRWYKHLGMRAQS
jgi:glycosyltransferase involved in cell wall biosynthesis